MAIRERHHPPTVHGLTPHFLLMEIGSNDSWRKSLPEVIKPYINPIALGIYKNLQNNTNKMSLYHQESFLSQIAFFSLALAAGGHRVISKNGFKKFLNDVDALSPNPNIVTQDVLDTVKALGAKDDLQMKYLIDERRKDILLSFENKT